MDVTMLPSLAEARHARGHLQRGFTLIELIATVTIAAILMAIATPYFRDFISGQRIRAAGYDIVAALIYARSEAIKRDSGVTVAPASGGWQNGWTVTSGTTTLSQHEALQGLTMTGPAGGLVYNGNGRLTATISPFGISAASSTAPQRCINVDLSGLPSSQAGSC
ncbi:GspH/FimT family pseudopilin [Cupriavidus basilensis]|uniref:Type II secretion system protein H n=1 Tax=Cupriavidus basilensis TaxID=68895 RepID=A0ABT6APW6_9BURK|nr:GspH/FimT family pseudopilin [Cupriavidus basilensis]MDF3834617.1 GspH/FimT family pseudopilin [Cupriavidus basilensis]